MTDEELRTARRSERAAKRSAKSAAKLARREAKRADSEAKRSELRTSSAHVVRIVFAMVGANAATQFAIQAWMSYRFARDVWAIPQPLCIAIIAALDLFAVTFMVFTYLLRTAGWVAKSYVWLVFAGGVGAQLFAAEQYGSHQAWTDPVRLFAALPALFLAASLHGLILWRNHATTRPAVPAPVVEAAAPPAPAAVKAPNEAPKTERPARPEVAPTPPPPASGRKPQVKAVRQTGPAPTIPASRIEAADRVIIDGTPAKDVAAELGVSKRAVEGWAAARRKQLAVPEPMPTLSLVTSGVVEQSDPEPVNGYAFGTGAAPEAQVN
jgi:hypothetical protein